MPKARRQRVGKKVLSKKALTEQHESQKSAQVTARALADRLERAKQAARKYRPRKGEKGSIQFITMAGKNASIKGRKGIPIYITKTGKKQLIHEPGKGAHKFLARKISDYKLPVRRNLRKAVEKFYQQETEIIGGGRGAIVGRTRDLADGRLFDGDINGRAGRGSNFDPEGKLIAAMARSIQKAIHSQDSRRRFFVNGKILVNVSGKDTVIDFKVPIDKADHIRIKLGGLKNFVRYQLYYFLATELKMHDVVLHGSANQIRKLKVNRGKPKEKWRDKIGKRWDGASLEVVKIEAIEWRIEQRK